jgi:hypothetical protein
MGGNRVVGARDGFCRCVEQNLSARKSEHTLSRERADVQQGSGNRNRNVVKLAPRCSPDR